MIKLLKKIFECQHRHTKEGFQQSIRFDRPIVIDYKECEDCGRILRCKVSFLDIQKPTVSMPPQHITLATDNKEVVTGTLNVAPTVHLSLDLTENPGQNRKEAEVVTPVKEKPVELPPAPESIPVVESPVPAQPAPLVEAEKAEETLEQEVEEGPFTPKPELPAPVPDGKPGTDEVLLDELAEEDQPRAQTQDEAMVEGQCFLKESRSSIAQRRRKLARRREKALETLKKTGKAKIPVQKKSGISFLDEPDRPSREDEAQ